MSRQEPEVADIFLRSTFFVVVFILSWMASEFLRFEKKCIKAGGVAAGMTCVRKEVVLEVER